MKEYFIQSDRPMKELMLETRMRLARQKNLTPGEKRTLEVISKALKGDSNAKKRQLQLTAAAQKVTPYKGD